MFLVWPLLLLVWLLSMIPKIGVAFLGIGALIIGYYTLAGLRWWISAGRYNWLKKQFGP